MGPVVRERRLASIQVTGELMSHWLTRGFWCAVPMENAIPPSSDLVDASYSEASGLLTLTFYSDYFDKLPEHENPPVLPAVSFRNVEDCKRFCLVETRD